MPAATNSAIVINKNTSKIYKVCILQVAFFSLKVVDIVFVSSSYDSMISSHEIVEPSIKLAKYFTFLQLHVEGFQI